jgi:hypothetical protein
LAGVIDIVRCQRGSDDLDQPFTGAAQLQPDTVYQQMHRFGPLLVLDRGCGTAIVSARRLRAEWSG